jgi:hypothetical protein
MVEIDTNKGHQHSENYSTRWIASSHAPTTAVLGKLFYWVNSLNNSTTEVIKFSTGPIAHGQWKLVRASVNFMKI